MSVRWPAILMTSCPVISKPGRPGGSCFFVGLLAIIIAVTVVHRAASRILQATTGGMMPACIVADTVQRQSRFYSRHGIVLHYVGLGAVA